VHDEADFAVSEAVNFIFKESEFNGVPEKVLVFGSKLSHEGKGRPSLRTAE
jgi:hypothetical protein